MKSFYLNLQPSPFYDDGRECLVVVKGSVLSLLGSGLLASKVAALCFEAKLVCSDRILTCRIKSICSPAKGGTGCYRFNYQPGS